MKNDEIYNILEHQAKLKCGKLWHDMNEREQLNAMLKISIVMIKGLNNGE